MSDKTDWERLQAVAEKHNGEVMARVRNDGRVELYIVAANSYTLHVERCEAKPWRDDPSVAEGISKLEAWKR